MSKTDKEENYQSLLLLFNKEPCNMTTLRLFDIIIKLFSYTDQKLCHENVYLTGPSL